MAKHIKVSLEHHLNRRYHVISHGRGRRPEITYGKFDLRYRGDGKHIRLPLESVDLTAALKARSDKEAELNAAPVIERKGMLQQQNAEAQPPVSRYPLFVSSVATDFPQLFRDSDHPPGQTRALDRLRTGSVIAFTPEH
jgi:hypothetical protein